MFAKRKQKQQELKQKKKANLEKQEHEALMQHSLTEQDNEKTTTTKSNTPAKAEEEKSTKLKELEQYYLNSIPQEIEDTSDVEEDTTNAADSDSDDEMGTGFSFFQDEDDGEEVANSNSDDSDDDAPNDLFGKVVKLDIEQDRHKGMIPDNVDSDDEDDEEVDSDDDDDEDGMADELDGEDDEAGEEDDENGEDDMNDDDDEDNEELDANGTESTNDNNITDEQEEESDVEVELPDDLISEFQVKGNAGKYKSQDNDSDDDNELAKGDYDKSFFAQEEEEEAPQTARDVTFNEMSLSRPLKKAIGVMGFVHPTPIQAKTIPVLLRGADVCASAVTGSGKTAAFLLPTLEKLLYRNRNEQMIRALVLLPTRELATQCFNVASNLARFTDITMCLVVGGDVNVKQQTDALRRNPDLVIATPGRIIDHLLNTANFGLEGVEVLILDEADRLLEMGFQPQIEEILNAIPKARQTMLFSATMTDSVAELIRLSLKNPRRIAIDNRANVSYTLQQEFVRIRGRNEVWREGVLMSLVTRTFTEQVIIFVNRKDTARRLVILFKVKKLKVSELHGNLTQSQRLIELRRFALGKTNFLICTDVAARGLDIKNVKTVINYEMPIDLKTYIHRVGRTARAGETGTSVSLTGEDDRIILKQIVKRAKKNGDSIKHRVIPNETILFWTGKIEGMADTIKQVELNDQVEKELDRAEMKATKMKNMVEFAGEIAARPKKEWIMSKDAEKNLKKREREEKGIEDRSNKVSKTKEGDVSKSKFAKKKEWKQMSRQEQRREIQKQDEQRVLQEHGIKNFNKFIKGVKGKARVTDKLSQKGIKVPEIVEAKKKLEAKKTERRELKKASRKAKRESKLKDKSADKRESEKIEREIFKSTKPKKANLSKGKQRYKRRK